MLTRNLNFPKELSPKISWPLNSFFKCGMVVAEIIPGRFDVEVEIEAIEIVLIAIVSFSFTIEFFMIFLVFTYLSWESSE